MTNNDHKRITTSENYFHEFDCPIDDCERRYCRTHRLLWRDCETLVEGIEGDRDVIGGTRVVYDLGDCPSCERDYRRKKYATQNA